jgi:hypothetical protein
MIKLLEKIDCSSGPQSKQQKMDLESEARNGQVSKRSSSSINRVCLDNKSYIHICSKLSKFTVPQLKEFIKEKNIKAHGTKKQDLIDAINTYIS